MNAFATDVADSIRQTRKEWGWYLALGILLIAVGAYAIYSGSAATIASVVVLGALLIIGGIAQLIAMFQARGAGHVILLLLAGALEIVVGFMLIQHPDAGALTVTLLIAALFVFSGIYTFVMANYLQFPQYGWVAFSGIVTAALGVLLWAQFPTSAEWFIGFAVGLNFIITGIAWSVFAFKLKPA
jgi:uncharacterized membrane protein HdeD (DUF308 family)